MFLHPFYSSVVFGHSTYPMQVCPSACVCFCQVLWDNAEPTALQDSRGCVCHTNLTQQAVLTSPKSFLSLCQNTAKGNTLWSLENVHTRAQVHAMWVSWEMSKNAEHMRKVRGRSPDDWYCPRCVCVRVRRNTMHHWTVQTQTVANAIRLTSGQGSLGNLCYAPHAQKLHTRAPQNTHTAPCLSVMSGNASFSVTGDQPALAPIAERSKQHITLLLRLSIYSARESVMYLSTRQWHKSRDWIRRLAFFTAP